MRNHILDDKKRDYECQDNDKSGDHYSDPLPSQADEPCLAGVVSYGMEHPFDRAASSRPQPDRRSVSLDPGARPQECIGDGPRHRADAAQIKGQLRGCASE
jgi:hypothetical protein